MATEVRVPTLGESVTEATVATWFKQPGEAVAVDEMLCELETDKVTVEVPAPVAGVMAEHVAKEGDTVGVDALLATIEAGEGAAAASPAPAAPAATPPEPTHPAAAAPSGNGAGPVASPSAQKMMAEAGMDPAAVSGTGKGGRIMKEDVARAASGAPAPAPAAPAAATDPAREKRVRMTRLRQTIARRLKDAQNTAAMLTTYNEVDMTEIMALRGEFKEEFVKKHGVKLGFMSFFVKACVHALHEVPSVNAEIDGDEIVYKNYYHMGVAVGTPTGLVVPIVRNADQLGFSEIEKTIAGLGEKARDGKLTMADMTGGTFTISNGGVYGSLMSSPIL
ncbi:MAG: 2-oxoglutarate dehydrogenase complex dihydrolipoyllysine-residue succinyltransferase, partial [Pseudomonadota bacterium]